MNITNNEKPVCKKNQLKLYGIIGSSSLRKGMDIGYAVEQAIEGGTTIIQLREKNRSEDEVIETAKSLINVCHRHNVPLIINDSIKIAYKSGADGVHLGLDDGNLLYARRVLGKNAIIGATAHNLYEAQSALAAGADYLGCGAVFDSTTKTNTVPLPIENLTEICRQIPLPIVAIGGINAENAMKLKKTGIAGIAVVSALFGQENICASAMLLKNIVSQFEA